MKSVLCARGDAALVTATRVAPINSLERMEGKNENVQRYYLKDNLDMLLMMMTMMVAPINSFERMDNSDYKVNT